VARRFREEMSGGGGREAGLIRGGRGVEQWLAGLPGSVLYADVMTDSLKEAVEETNRRRATQEAFNTEHGIEPRTIVKDIASPLLALSNLDYHDAAYLPPAVGEVDVTGAASLAKAISELEKQMKAAAKRLKFEEAAQLRGRIKELRAQQIYKS